MSYLKINHDKVTADNIDEIKGLCPFSAINEKEGKLNISSACKMCKICVKKSGGVIEFIEETVERIDKSKWNGICVYADIREGQIHPVTFELIGKAKELAKPIQHEVMALVIGYKTEEAVKEILEYGVDKVYVYDYPELKEYKIDTYTNAFEDFIGKVKPSSILVGATNIGRSLAPRVAARMRTGLTADCTILKIKDNTDLVQIRPAFGGNIMAQIITPNCRPQFCTARYKIFSAPQKQEPFGEVVNMQLTPDKFKSSTDVLKTIKKKKGADLTEAQVIIAVGRGVKAEKDLEMIRELANNLNARVACTRPLIENGWFDPRKQIGLSGRTVKPKLIITLGVSGAVQFIAGMSSSDLIIAVNSDENAPIFEVSHYGVVGDLYEIVPRLNTLINEREGIRYV